MWDRICLSQRDIFPPNVCRPLACLMCLALVSILLSTQAMESSCEVPSVYAGQTAIVTCHFSSNVQEQGGYFVHRYNFTDAAIHRDQVLSCDKFEGNKFDCSLAAGYQYNYSSSHTNTFPVDIPKAGPQHVGRFVCTALGQDTRPVIRSCNFTLKKGAATTSTSSPVHSNVQTTTSSESKSVAQSGGSDTVIIAVIVSVVLIAVLTTAIVIIYWKRRTRKTAGGGSTATYKPPTSSFDQDADERERIQC